MRYFSFVVCNDVQNNLIPNLSSLRNNGVPESRNFKFMKNLQFLKSIATAKPDRFHKVVLDVIGMGFSPLGTSFLYAIFARQNETFWLGRHRTYESLGFFKTEILSKFRKEPRTMCFSEKRIRNTVEFFLKKFHWSPTKFSARPHVMMHSLEKRIIPRCSVLQVLVSKKWIQKGMNVSTLMQMTEKDFFSSFVNEYRDNIPEVLDAYHGKLEFDEYNFDTGKTKDALVS